MKRLKNIWNPSNGIKSDCFGIFVQNIQDTAMRLIKTKYFLLLILAWFFVNQNALCQTTSLGTVCMSADEMKLAALINNLRKQNKLPEIPLSVSLTYVAKTHVADLQTNKPDTSICNTASWSDKGRWTPCCFNSYVLKYECMWDKPKELTSYNFRGYELSYFEEGIVNVDSVFKLWNSTSAARDMLLTREGHADKKWLAMGLGLSENYISVWFGQRADPAGRPYKCDNEKQETFAASFTNEKKDSTKTSTSTKYYIIYGSFNSRADANEAVRRYKNSGLKNVQILEKEGRFRIAIDVHDNLKDAMNAKEKLSSSYPEAWIFKD